MSRTARYVALFRALESTRPPGHRLFEDEFARGFLDRPLRLVAGAARVPLLGSLIPWYIDRRWPCARASVVVRTRLIDDTVTDALAAGMRQFVILGAGFDSRPYRIAALARGRVFEVDRGDVLAAKSAAVARMTGSSHEHVVYVAVDFERDDLGERLTASGFRVEPALFVWEGVTSYLTEAGVDATLRRIRAASAPGSAIVLTYLDRRALDGSLPGLNPWAAAVDAAGEPFRFGFDPRELPQYLAERGFELADDVSAAEGARRHLQPLGRGEQASPVARVARACVRGSELPRL